MFEWVREANRGRGAGVGDDDLREMLDVLALANLLERDADRGAGRGRARSRDARERARADRDYAEADRLRDELRAWAGRSATARDGPELLPLP